MKKKVLFSALLAIFAVSALAANAAEAKTATTSHIKTKKIVSVKPKVIWEKSGLKELYKVPSFARKIYKQKVEAYAIENGIKIINAETFKSIHV